MNIRRNLERDGFAFIAGWRALSDTEKVARSLGVLWKLGPPFELSGIPDIQELSPKKRDSARRNSYSSAFGLSEFPLHTDLAHLRHPPRYLVLRCIKGFASVQTQVLRASEFASTVGRSCVEKALVRPRWVPAGHKLCMLPLKFRTDGDEAMRWDSKFLVPMNKSAERIALSFHAAAWEKAIYIRLENPGDTLIVDNYQALHGRSAVPAQAIDRRIERAYLSEVF
ncbi:MAG: TauD/TfdA family dioxygenase [Chloroflexota bacterium]|nr:TauD/TfdA family dioxygenase [Chloroflexota bacterium]